MRTPEQLLKAWDKATKDKPLELAADECDNFSKAMKLSYKTEDKHSPNITLQDRDILLKDGIVSPLDQKSAFTNRREWANHLKANGCVEIGNDYNNLKPPAEIKGDFDCRKELSQATHQIMDKYGN